LDGKGHFESVQNQKDLERDSRLTELGFRVLRFENQFVFDHLPNVLNTIKSEFQY
jgi:very-short-patch-repair endonuclease